MQSHDEARAVIQTLRDYYAASNKQDVQQMVSYYHEPVMFITPRGVRNAGDPRRGNPSINGIRRATPGHGRGPN